MLRRELGEDWIQSLKTELEPTVQKLLGEGQKEDAWKYTDKQETEEEDNEKIGDKPSEAETNEEEGSEEGER